MKVGEQMASYDVDRPLKLGEVKTIRSNGGKKLEHVELLFSTTKIDLLMDNTDFKYQDLNCALSKNVIRDIYMIFRDLYNELEDEESEDKE